MGLTIEERFKEAIQLRDHGHTEEAISKFHGILNDFAGHPQIAKIYTMLGGLYRDVDDSLRSMEYFKRATELSPHSELASLGLYVSYVKLDKDENAILELKRYLSENKAGMYIDTLEELLAEIAEGRLGKYRDIIIDLAKKNNLEIV